MSVLEQIEKALGDRDDWRAEVAKSLARQMDADANSSMARELRALMEGIEGDAPSVGGTPLDEVARRRAARAAG